MNLLTPKEAAQYLGISEVTLRRLRARDEGPSWVKLSPQIIRYEKDALVSFIKQQTRGGKNQ